MLTLLICSLNNRVVDLDITNHLSPISTSVLWNIQGKSAFSRKCTFELFQSDVCAASFRPSNCRVKEMSSTLKDIYICVHSIWGLVQEFRLSDFRLLPGSIGFISCYPSGRWPLKKIVKWRALTKKKLWKRVGQFYWNKKIKWIRFFSLPAETVSNKCNGRPPGRLVKRLPKACREWAEKLCARLQWSSLFFFWRKNVLQFW